MFQNVNTMNFIYKFSKFIINFKETLL